MTPSSFDSQPRISHGTWRFLGGSFLPWIAAPNLAWEIVQLPLYTLWDRASFASIAFAVIHCTAGDVLIAEVCLILALLLVREDPLGRGRRRTALAIVVAGTLYTAFSEWRNTSLQAWSYSEWMPTLGQAGLEIGLAPLLQWMIVPPLALHLAARDRRAPEAVQSPDPAKGAPG